MFKTAFLNALYVHHELHLVPVPHHAEHFQIAQADDFDNFRIIAKKTFVEPFPVLYGHTETIHVDGYWSNQSGADLEKVDFDIYMAGHLVFNESYDCTNAASKKCPRPSGRAGEEWHGTFDFDLPTVMPPSMYDVRLTAWTKDNKKMLWQLHSAFHG